MAHVKKGQEKIREENLSKVLNYLFYNKTLSRADLAKLTGLTRATAGSLVDELISTGYVTEIGKGESTQVGKPAIQLQICRDHIFAVSVHLYFDEIVVARVNLLGEPVHIIRRKLPNSTSFFIIKKMYELIHSEINIMKKEGSALAGIGVAIPAPLLDRKVAYPASFRPLENGNIYEALKEEFDCPIYVENDADCAALAERWFGSAFGKDRIFFLLVNSGIGSGFSYKGRLYYGVHKITPEFGHTIIDPNGPTCFCGNHGCVATVASDLALYNYYTNDGVLNNELSYSDVSPDQIHEVITKLTAMDESELPEYVSTVADNLGIAISNLMSILCVDAIVVSGKIFEIPNFFNRVRDRVRKYVHPVLSSYTTLQKTSLGDTAPLIGAATFLIRDLYIAPTNLDAVE